MHGTKDINSVINSNSGNNNQHKGINSGTVGPREGAYGTIYSTLNGTQTVPDVMTARYRKLPLDTASGAKYGTHGTPAVPKTVPGGTPDTVRKPYGDTVQQPRLLRGQKRAREALKLPQTTLRVVKPNQSKL